MDTNSPIDLQWEVAVFVCFLGLMMYVPFNPWNFDPGQAFEVAMQSGQQLAQQAGGAAGQAASAAGVPQSQINQVGQAFNHATAGMNEFSQNIYQAQNGIVNGLNPALGGTGAGAQGSGQGQGQGQASHAPPAASAPAPQQAAAMNPTSVATSMPPQTSGRQEVASNDGSGSHSAPPNASPSSDNQSVAAASQVAPANASVSEQNQPYVPLAASGAGVQMAVNGNVTPAEAQQGVASLQPQLAAAGVSGGNTAGAPPTSETSSSSSSASSAAAPPPPPTQLASNDVPPPANPGSSSNPSNGSEGPPVA